MTPQTLESIRNEILERLGTSKRNRRVINETFDKHLAGVNKPTYLGGPLGFSDGGKYFYDPNNTADLSEAKKEYVTFGIGSSDKPTPQPDDSQACREAFEKWCIDMKISKKPPARDGERYKHIYHQIRWRSWEGAWKSKPPTDEDFKKHASQKALDIIASFYNILKERDDEIALLKSKPTQSVDEEN